MTSFFQSLFRTLLVTNNVEINGDLVDPFEAFLSEHHDLEEDVDYLFSHDSESGYSTYTLITA